MRVSVDASRCQGHGRCYELSPEIFLADDQGMSVVMDGPWTSARDVGARLAADNCPERAIVVENDGAGR